MTTEAFWEKVNKTETCWFWTGLLDTHGYGFAHLDGKMQRAHRYAFVVCGGSIPEGLTLDHLCRNRHCVRPDHLEPVDNRTNVLRGTGHTANNARKTHCVHGHALSGDNVGIYRRSGSSRTRRTCMTCQRNSHKKYYKAKQEAQV
jgi:hypothetical protein